MFICRFCSKELKNIHAKAGHGGWCNPETRISQEAGRIKWKETIKPEFIERLKIMGKNNKGKIRTPEMLKHLSDAHMGYKQTEEHIQNVKNALAKPDVKEKMSQNTKDLFANPEWRAKNVAAMTATSRTPEQREIRRKIRLSYTIPTKGTSIELKLWAELKQRGILFERDKATFGITIPDAFIEPNICIYVDGCYWHACPEHYPLETFIDTRWHFKISQKTQTDKDINEKLIKAGYKVFRFWEHEIKKDVKACVDQIYG